MNLSAPILRCKSCGLPMIDKPHECPGPFREATLGERRVRTKFNPSDHGMVDRIKQKTAELIDLVNAIPREFTDNGECQRLISLALVAYEEAAMWAVKAATA